MAKPLAPLPLPSPLAVQSAATSPKLTAAINAIAALVTAEPTQPEPQVPAVPQTQTSVIRGILRTSSGLPLKDVQIIASPVETPSAGRPRALTDSDGRYRLENIPPGRYHILIGSARFYHPGVTDSGQAAQIQVASGANLEVETVVSGGPVTGRIVATQMGRPLEDLVLCCDYFQTVRYSESGLKQGVPLIPTIAGDGSFVFPFVPAGNYALSIRDKNVMPLTWALAVGPNGASGLQLNVVEGIQVQGTVQDLIGNPVAADIRLVPRLARSRITVIGQPMYTPATQFNFLTGGQPTGPLVVRAILVPRAFPSLDEVQDLILKSANSARMPRTLRNAGTRWTLCISQGLPRRL